MMDDQTLINNWQQVTDETTTACQQAGRAEDDVRLLAVSKTKPAAMIKTLAAQGQRDFGENYLQEAVEKIQAIAEGGINKKLVWHYIGHIQRNKTRDIAEHFDWVQTVEREIIARRLNNQRPDDMPPLNVLIQVNIDDEDSKSGCLPEDVPALIDAIKPRSRRRS